MNLLFLTGKKIRVAVRGMRVAFFSDTSFTIHLFYSLLACFVGLILGLSLLEWILMIFAIGQIVVSELLNTAIEYVVRMITDEYHELAKNLLDISAGAVVFAIFIFVIIIVLIFVPKVYFLIGSLLEAN